MAVKKERNNVGSAFGDELIQALQEAVAFEQGKLPDVRVDRIDITERNATVDPPPAYSPDRIRDIRKRMRMSQPVFAQVLNASPATVRAWEQGTREPDGPSRRLLQVAERNAESLVDGILRRKQA